VLISVRDKSGMYNIITLFYLQVHILVYYPEVTAATMQSAWQLKICLYYSSQIPTNQTF